MRLHNEARSEWGLEALCVQEDLMTAARGHSEDMIQRDFYGHEDPDGATPGDRILHAGYPFAAYGENISRMSRSHGGESGRSELLQVFEGWMESQGHRENILKPEFREISIGVETGIYTDYPGTTTMYTVDFGAHR